MFSNATGLYSYEQYARNDKYFIDVDGMTGTY
jgi:hypothetical protein